MKIKLPMTKKIDDVFYDLPLLKNVHCTVTQSNVKVCICM